MLKATAAQALALAEKTLAMVSGADQASVSVQIADAAYSRYTHNYVTQNLDSVGTNVSLTYIKNKKQGTSTTTDVSDAGLRALVARTADIASRVPANNEFVSLPPKATYPAAAQSTFASTVDATPDARIDKLVPVFDRMKRASINAAGYLTTAQQATAIVNTLGVRASWEGSGAGLEVKAMAPHTSGFASAFNRDFTQINAAERAELAAQKATISQEPQDFPPGTYTVILEPPALVDCINNLYYGLNIGAVLENQDSWLIKRLDTQVLSPNFTLTDDWSHPLMANAPFASDGAPTQKLTLIDKGVPKNYVSGTYLANKYKKPNTGHDGYPTNAIVMPGTKSREQLIAETERGILVSRTWYTRVVDPREVTITGLTRDGVFLIENGKLTKTLKNFRFFTSMLTALKDVEFSNKLSLAESSDAPSLLAVPDAKIMKFTFSAQASFA